MNTCPSCQYNNLDESLFCQECGKSLTGPKNVEEYQIVWTCDFCDKEFSSKDKSDYHELICLKNPGRQHRGNKTKTIKKSLYKELNVDIVNDVIFEPKAKDRSWLWGVGIVGVIILFSYFIISSYNDTYDSSTSDIVHPTPTSYTSQYTLLTNLSVVDYKIKWISGESYFVGTMKNENSQHIREAVIRIDFAWDEAMEKIFDTRYVTVGAVPSKGAFTFQLPLNFYQTKNNWYQFKIESADVY